MSSFKINPVDSAPEESKLILQEVEKNMGFIPNLLRVASESPVALKSYVTLMKLLKSGTLSETERQVVFLETSHLNDCSYCMAAHSKLAKMFKINPEIIHALRDGKTITDQKLEALRKFARAIVKSKGFVKESDIREILAVGYNHAQILEMIVCITVKTLTNLLSHVAEIPLDEAFSSEKWQHPAAK